MVLALDDSFPRDVMVLNSSQAVQNSMFSSQNSDFRNIWNAAFPSAGQNEEGIREREQNKASSGRNIQAEVKGQISTNQRYSLVTTVLHFKLTHLIRINCYPMTFVPVSYNHAAIIWAITLRGWHLHLWLRSLSSDCAHWLTSSTVGLRKKRTVISEQHVQEAYSSSSSSKYC